MTAVLFAGGGIDTVTVLAGTVADISSSGFDTTYSDSAINSAQSRNSSTTGATGGHTWRASFRDPTTMALTTVTSGQTAFAHASHFVNDNASSLAASYAFWMVDSADGPWLSVRYASAGLMGLYGNTGTAAAPTWTLLGSTFGWSTSREDWDLKLTLGSPHSAEFYINGALKASGTFTNASLTNIGGFCGTSYENSIPNTWSQLLGTEGLSTINAKVFNKRASGAGTTSGWSGAYTDVNEAVLSDTTVLTALTAGLKTTLAYGDVTVPTGYSIGSVWLWTRANNDGGAPANLKPVCRSSGTDYSGSSFSGMAVGIGNFPKAYSSDPATSAAWTQSGYNAAEFGVESAT